MGTADGRSREGTGLAAILVGRMLAAWAVFAGLTGAVSALWPTAMANAVPSASFGIILGLVGYFLGARGLAVGHGLLPWTGPTDPITN